MESMRQTYPKIASSQCICIRQHLHDVTLRIHYDHNILSIGTLYKRNNRPRDLPVRSAKKTRLGRGFVLMRLSRMESERKTIDLVHVEILTKSPQCPQTKTRARNRYATEPHPKINMILWQMQEWDHKSISNGQN
jgi:hypothetical protein